MTLTLDSKQRRFVLCTLVVLGVASAQLWLVKCAGTDVPFWDQWDVEGKVLYPAWVSQNLTFADLFRSHNEHRIFWTKALDLFLFQINGAWDPLIQQTANVFVRAAAVGVLALLLIPESGMVVQTTMGIAVLLGYLPILGWHTVLWGFETQVDFSLLFGWAALGLIGTQVSLLARTAGALALGISAQLAMGSGLLLPSAFLLVAGANIALRRRFDRGDFPFISLGALLAVSALILRVNTLANAGFHSLDFRSGVEALVRVLAWPHYDLPMAALVLSCPAIMFFLVLFSKRGELDHFDYALVGLTGWIVALAAGMAYSRGGSAELAAGLPSRYADFVMMWPLINLGFCFRLLRLVPQSRKRLSVFLTCCWGAFVFAGWLGTSAVMWRGIIIPRIHDRAAPERFARAFQVTGNPAVFAGAPRLYIPHPDLSVISTVLNDARLATRMPPTFQPTSQPRWLSCWVRTLLLHDRLTIVLLWVLGIGSLAFRMKSRSVFGLTINRNTREIHL